MQSYLLIPPGLVISSSADSQQNRRPIYFKWDLKVDLHELSWHRCNAMTLFICCLFLLTWRHMAKQRRVFGHHDPEFGSKTHNQSLELKPGFLVTLHKTLPNDSKPGRPFPARSHVFYFRSHLTQCPRLVGSLCRWLWSLPFPLDRDSSCCPACCCSCRQQMPSARSLLFFCQQRG